MDDGAGTVKTVPLRRLIQSVENGVWGGEPGTDEVDVACVRAADFDFSSMRVSLSRAPTRSVPTRSFDRLRLRSGDIVLEKSGGGEAAPVGRSVIFDLNEPAVTSNFAARVRPTSDVDPRYLNFVLRSHYDAGATLRCIKQTTGIQNLDTEEWLATPTIQHSVLAQRRIADFLDDRVGILDQVIAARRAQAAAAVEQYEAARASALLSRDWPERRLSHVARMGTGHTPSRSNEDYWRDCTIPWLTTGDVRRFRKDEIDVIEDTALRISALGLANSAAVLHPAGTVALSRTASAGFSIVMGKGMATSQDFATWTCGDDLVPEFLLHTLRARRSFLLGYLSMGSTHKTIYFPDLMDLTIGLPSIQVQRSAVADVRRHGGERTQMLSALERQSHLLAEYKTSLIHAAVTGQLDVTTAGSGIPA